MSGPPTDAPAVTPPRPPGVPDRLAVELDPDIDPDFPDVEGVDVTDLELSFPDARTFTILRSRLTECTIAGDTDASLDAVDSVFVDLDLTGRSVEALTRVELVRCRLGGADFGDAELTDVHLDGCVLDLASMRGTRLQRVTISGGRVDGLDVSGAHLTDVTLVDLSLGEVTLDGARLERVDLTGADLAGVTDMRTIRGATMSEVQAVALSVRLARAAGITISRSS